MAATTTANRPPPAHPGPNGGTPPPRANDGPPAQQQDPGLHGGSQDPGPSAHPQHHVSGRPLFYVHAPPPPPFLQYQWPMPFSYYPFAGFPGMGESVYFLLKFSCAVLRIQTFHGFPFFHSLFEVESSALILLGSWFDTPITNLLVSFRTIV